MEYVKIWTPLKRLSLRQQFIVHGPSHAFSVAVERFSHGRRKRQVAGEAAIDPLVSERAHYLACRTESQGTPCVYPEDIYSAMRS